MDGRRAGVVRVGPRQGRIRSLAARSGQVVRDTGGSVIGEGGLPERWAEIGAEGGSTFPPRWTGFGAGERGSGLTLPPSLTLSNAEGGSRDPPART